MRATIAQGSGSGNQAYTDQQGDRLVASISQTGSNNYARQTQR